MKANQQVTYFVFFKYLHILCTCAIETEQETLFGFSGKSLLKAIGLRQMNLITRGGMFEHAHSTI